MKHTFLRYTAFVLVTLFFAGLVTALGAEVVNRIVLRVNDRIATLYDYEMRKADRLRAIGAQTSLDPAQREQMLKEVGKTVMREIFDELLILSRADQLGIVASPQQIDEAMVSMRERSGIENDQQFRMALAQSGLTYEDLRGQIERNLVWEGVVGREIAPLVEVNEDVLRRYYRAHEEDFLVPEQIELQEIVVLVDEETGSAATDLATEIHRRLQSGETMETLAESFSPRTSSVINLGWVQPGDLDPSLEAAVWSLESGQISDPIEARGGLHIFKVLGRRDESAQPFNEVSEEIYSIERNRLFSEAVETYLKDLEESSYYSGDVPPEARGFRSASGRAVLEENVQHFETRLAPAAGDPEASGEGQTPDP